MSPDQPTSKFYFQNSLNRLFTYFFRCGGEAEGNGRKSDRKKIILASFNYLRIQVLFHLRSDPRKTPFCFNRSITLNKKLTKKKFVWELVETKWIRLGSLGTHLSKPRVVSDNLQLSWIVSNHSVTT